MSVNFLNNDHFDISIDRSLARPLSAVHVREQMATAWDEGIAAVLAAMGITANDAESGYDIGITDNPYRSKS